MTPERITDLIEAQAAEDARLHPYVLDWTTCGIVEIAARNPSVMEYMAHWEGRAEKAEAALEAKAAELALLRAALERIAQWADAYPLAVFPEPDMKAVAVALTKAGLSLDAVSASNMRHVVEGVGAIARAALAHPTGGTAA